MKSFISWNAAQIMADDTLSKGGVVVTTNGCFDILHRGHLSYLEASRKLGDILIVGINSDSSIKKIKGPDRPINSQNDRAMMLSALRFVDAVCIFDEDTPVNWLNMIRPKIHTKGADYKGKEMPETAALETWGGKISFIDFVENYSTTELIKKLKK
jgi:rfaE bifunctional protein nucleotidyltransferase chain/domain